MNRPTEIAATAFALATFTAIALLPSSGSPPSPAQGASGASAEATATPPGAPDIYKQRLRKYRIIAEHYPDSGIYPWIGTIIREHERRGMGSEIWWSFAYGAANCSLHTGVRFPNGCAGPFDRPGGPTDPLLNIRAHCDEWEGFYHRGITGYDAAKHVFYPRRPHDWGGGRIWQAHLEHEQIIETAYREGRL
ncbi:MAG: hypothetical protein ACLFWB_08390 [Armatimonadota bacterium]